MSGLARRTRARVRSSRKASSSPFRQHQPLQREQALRATLAGKPVGSPQVALKLPFAFPLISGGNAYDFSQDLATVVYARPNAHADLYLLTQK